MAAWQIFSDGCNTFRWEICSTVLETKPLEAEPAQRRDYPPERRHPHPRLPSMRDLLSHQCPKLIENESSAIGSSPMFRTGTGKSVAMKDSSIAKAKAVIGDVNSTNAGCSMFNENGGGRVGIHQMFRTGSGKPAALNQSSIAKAKSLLDEDDFTDAGSEIPAKFRGNVSRENACRYSDSLSRMGSGKMVNLSSDGLVKAKTLLGLEENDSRCSFQGLEYTRKQPAANVLNGLEKKSCLETISDVNYRDTDDAKPLLCSREAASESESKAEAVPNFMQLEVDKCAVQPPPIKFHTAGGRFISVSSDALQRARSLLGQSDLVTFLDERKEEDAVFQTIKNGGFDGPFYENSDLSASSSPKKYSECKGQQGSLSRSNLKISHGPLTQLENSRECISGSLNRQGGSSTMPLVDISNTINAVPANKKHTVTEKRRLVRSSISPFKRPRNSKFITPLNSNMPVSNGCSTLSTENMCCKKTLSTRYPFSAHRVYVKEYFGGPPTHQAMSKDFPDNIRWMNPDRAGKYMFHEKSDLGCMGAEAFRQLLVQSGASPQYACKEWVTNHYKWIVWKLACYERSYPAKSSGRFLTVSNVLEELKYRYVREVNHGHRSIIKRILEGDALPSSMMVLCISAIPSSHDLRVETPSHTGDNLPDAVKLELTDGWYSIHAFLDTCLARQFKCGKLHLGKKLRIWGSGLCGWVGPVSPLELPNAASLSLHVNGTYRAHWADKLGLCKAVGAPLAFRCIKSGGGPVPLTLVGVKRIYPVLFRERLSNGGYIIRSERMESNMMQLHNQQRSVVVEDIISEFERGRQDFHTYNDHDSGEGAQILKLLETAAEPEFIMAGLTGEQLNCIATYQARLEANRQAELQKSIEKALDEAGLNMRDVTPFMRVRVVGLTNRSCRRSDCPREGLITTWNPMNKQKPDLVEGLAYAVQGLVPSSSDSHSLYLQARGSSTRWKPLTPSGMQHYKPFFSPRLSVLLSKLGEVPFSSEFDIAALIVYVGEVYTDVQRKRQWLFVTDCSTSEIQSEDLSSSLLAISFCLPYAADSSAPINHNLAGSVACFCNLIKRAKDHINHLWVAEATENSTYLLNYDQPYCSHLKNAAIFTERWAKVSSGTVDKIKDKVLFMTRNQSGGEYKQEGHEEFGS